MAALKAYNRRYALQCLNWRQACRVCHAEGRHWELLLSNSVERFTASYQDFEVRTRAKQFQDNR